MDISNQSINVSDGCGLDNDASGLEMLKKWAKAGTQNNTLLIMQVNHTGKQSPAVVNKTPLAPSAAHGYLISQFLSPHHNRCQDQWGGGLENRMRFLLETYTVIRAAVGKDFLVGVKLNSADFQKGGFDESESVQWYKSYRKWALILLKFPVATTKARKCSPPKTAPANAKPSLSITPKKPVQPAKFHS